MQFNRFPDKSVWFRPLAGSSIIFARRSFADCPGQSL